MPAFLPRSLLLTATILLALARGAGAAEEKTTEARRLYSEATAAFGVGNYEEAAEKYEGSFKLHPDAALLYNAAQSYRMAGNRERALQLYRNFVRLYGDNPRAEDARNHTAALEKAIADAAKPGPPAPAGAAPPPTSPAETAPLPMNLTPASPAASPPTLVETRSDTGAGNDSVLHRPWFWVAVGAVVVGGTVAALLATRSSSYPDATLGRLD